MGVKTTRWPYAKWSYRVDADASLMCMDGTILFSIRQLGTLVVLMGEIALQIGDTPRDRSYMRRLLVPVSVLCTGAFLAVLNDRSKAAL